MSEELICFTSNESKIRWFYTALLDLKLPVYKKPMTILNY